MRARSSSVAALSRWTRTKRLGDGGETPVCLRQLGSYVPRRRSASCVERLRPISPPESSAGGRLNRARLGAARDPRRRPLPRPADRVLARQLRRLPRARRRRRARLSAILRATLVPGGRVLAARWIPIALVGGLLRPDPTGTSTKLVGALAQDFPTDHWNIRSECVPDPDHHPLTVWLVQRGCSSPAEDISGCLDLPRSSPSEAVVTGRLCFASSRLPLICAVSTSQAASG